MVRTVARMRRSFASGYGIGSIAAILVVLRHRGAGDAAAAAGASQAGGFASGGPSCKRFSHGTLSAGGRHPAEASIRVGNAGERRAMRIAKIEDLHCNAGWRDFTFLKVTSDEGLVGWSEYMEGYGALG